MDQLVLNKKSWHYAEDSFIVESFKSWKGKFCRKVTFK